LDRLLICFGPSRVDGQLFFFSGSVWGAERTACRRLISLICAGWLPHDNGFVGELPLSSGEDHSVSGCLIAPTRVLPPLSVLLPTPCAVVVDPYMLAGAGPGNALPMAQRKPASSRAMAVHT